MILVRTPLCHPPRAARDYRPALPALHRRMGGRVGWDHWDVTITGRRHLTANWNAAAVRGRREPDVTSIFRQCYSRCCIQHALLLRRQRLHAVVGTGLTSSWTSGTWAVPPSMVAVNSEDGGWGRGRSSTTLTCSGGGRDSVGDRAAQTWQTARNLPPPAVPPYSGMPSLNQAAPRGAPFPLGRCPRCTLFSPSDGTEKAACDRTLAAETISYDWRVTRQATMFISCRACLNTAPRPTIGVENGDW